MNYNMQLLRKKKSTPIMRTIPYSPPTNSPKLIIDCFSFYNEIEMLEYRLSILYEVVDYFVICESCITFMGHPKPSFYLENKNKYERFSDKIIHILLTHENTKLYKNPNVLKGEQWINENTQKNSISLGIYSLIQQGKLGNNPYDLINICDLDEIPNPELLKFIKYNPKNIITDGASLAMDFYYYNLNCINKGKWSSAKIVSFDYYMNYFKKIIYNIRMYKFNLTLNKAGWHLSYFGDKYFIKNKLKTNSHADEFDKEKFTNLNYIQEKIDNKIDLFEKNNNSWSKILFEENNFLPPNWEFFNYLL